MRSIGNFSTIRSAVESELHHLRDYTAPRKSNSRLCESKIQVTYWIFPFLLLLFAQSIVSQSYVTRKNYTGYWESPESWSPRWNSPLRDLEFKEITINGFIKCESTLKLIRDVELIVEDTLVIEGNLELEVGADVLIEDDAILIVMGTLVVRRPAMDISIGENGYLVVAGKLDIHPPIGSLNAFDGDDDLPKLFIKEEVLGPPEMIKGFPVLSCIDSENRYSSSGCTYGDFVDFANDPLYSFYETLLLGDPALITVQPFDVVSCQGDVVQFILEAQKATKYQWEVDDGSGYADVVDGTFISGSFSNTLTITDVEGIFNGYLYRCKVTGEDGNDIWSNPASLTVFKQVTLYAGNDTTICVNNTYEVTGTSVEYGNGTYHWLHNGHGTLTNVTTLAPIYTPDVSDAGQNITLTLTAEGNGDCDSASDQLIITVQEQVTVEAGNDASICAGNSYKVVGASVEHGNGTFSWSHNGQGNLTDEDTLAPTYTPDPSDSGETIVLTLTAQGDADCASATDQLIITVEEQVLADAGNDASICVNSTYKVAGATVEHGNGTFSWSHNGQGILINDDTLAPTYLPDALDAGETVILTLSADGNADCASATDQMQITVFKEVTGSAMPADEICGTSYLMETADDAVDRLWEQVGGPGSTTFLPSNHAERPRISVSEPGKYLFRRTLSNGACTNESTVEINFKEVPKASIEADTAVCGWENRISALPKNVDGHWQIVSGAEGATLDKDREARNNKIVVEEAGRYEILWIANLGGCRDTANRSITFHERPEVDAGALQELYYVSQTTLQATLQPNETGRWEVEEGEGVFEDIYSPTSKVTHLQVGDNIFDWVVNNKWCESKGSVQIIVNETQIPNVITPNGDSKNDCFVIRNSQDLGPIQLVIFNRWGSKVFESANYQNDWDGRDLNNHELIEDTYYYYLQFENKKVIKGYVYIQR